MDFFSLSGEKTAEAIFRCPTAATPKEEAMKILRI
jgi:hypothetical protein